VPDTAANAEAFGYAAGSQGRSGFPKVRVVSISECGSHAMVAAEISGRAGTGEQVLARRLYPRLEPDWLVIADRNFYSFTDWQRATATGAQPLWRVKRSLRLPVLDRLADGSYTSILVTRGVRFQPIGCACTHRLQAPARSSGNLSRRRSLARSGMAAPRPSACRPSTPQRRA
jgi:hypothetical protein